MLRDMSRSTTRSGRSDTAVSQRRQRESTENQEEGRRTEGGGTATPRDALLARGIGPAGEGDRGQRDEKPEAGAQSCVRRARCEAWMGIGRPLNCDSTASRTPINRARSSGGTARPGAIADGPGSPARRSGETRSGDEARSRDGVAHISDDLPLFHLSAGRDAPATLVRCAYRVRDVVRVTDLDGVSVGAPPPCPGHAASPRGVHGRAPRRAVVDAEVRPGAPEDRVEPSQVEAARDTDDVHRCEQGTAPGGLRPLRRSTPLARPHQARIAPRSGCAGRSGIRRRAPWRRAPSRPAALHARGESGTHRSAADRARSRSATRNTRETRYATSKRCRSLSPSTSPDSSASNRFVWMRPARRRVSRVTCTESSRPAMSARCRRRATGGGRGRRRGEPGSGPEIPRVGGRNGSRRRAAAGGDSRTRPSPRRWRASRRDRGHGPRIRPPASRPTPDDARG